MPDLKMLNSTKYLYKLTFIKCSYERSFRHSSFFAQSEHKEPIGGIGVEDGLVV